MNFWKLFRIIFVFFSLFLLGDAFFRWDAFKFYGSFSEFLPAVALISVLWSFIALLFSLLLWTLLRIFQWICSGIKLTLKIEHLTLCLGLFMFLGGISWGSKKMIWPALQTSLHLKMGILIGCALLSIILTWIFRKMADLWMSMLNERITPLVWLFSLIVTVSFALVSYLALSTENEHAASNNIVEYSAGGESRPNIILVTFDALTARDMSVYGFDKETTPFISEWAKSATIFTKHEAASNYTAPTTSTLMTGKRVWTHRRFQSNGGKTDKSDTESLPLLLKNNGYDNMAFIANDLASVQEMGMVESFTVAPLSNEFMEPASVYGFLKYYLYKLFNTKIKMYYWILQEDFILFRLVPNFIKYPDETQFPVEKIFDMFMDAMDNDHREPYFAWIHLFPPHMPYLPPDGYIGAFDSSPEFRTAKALDDIVLPRYFTPEQQPEADIIRSRYDEFILYCDTQFQDFIEQLEQKDLLKNTVIILSSDHGESFEHGYFTHGGPFLFEQQTNIPLIIKEPGQKEGQIVDDPVDQTDLPATILELAGISVPSWMEGRSLVPLLRRKELQPRPVFSMTLIEVPVDKKIETGTIAVWEGDYKLIHYLFNKESMLFNLKEDPDERDNLFFTEIEIAQHLLSLIQDNLQKANERILGED